MARGPGPGSRDSQWNGEESEFDSRPDEIGCEHELRIPGWRPTDCGTSRQSRQCSTDFISFEVFVELG